LTGAELDRSRFYKTTFQNVVEQLGLNATLQTHVVDRVYSTDRIDQRNLDAILLRMAQSITNRVFEAWNRIFGRAPVEHAVQLDVEHIPELGVFLEMKIRTPDGYYELSERSLGFRWFFMYLLLTSFNIPMGLSSKPLILLDEPASNLHSTAQVELLKSFEALLDRCNIVYSTHSHHLINIRWLDTAYIVRNAALDMMDDMDQYLNSRIAGSTSITATRYRQFVAQHPDQVSYFQPVLDVLDYRPSIFEPLPDMIFVEGKSDFFIIRYLSDVIGVDSGLNLAPGGGAGAMDGLVRLYIGWAKSFLILLDGDKEGEKQLQRYRDKFGPFVAGRCLALPDACGDRDVLEIEDLLSDADRSTIVSAVFGPDQQPTKKLILQSVLELVANKQSVQLEDQTVERFRQLWSELGSRLSQ
jgi:AAA domain, putative AbiEii toxin, Type IV TA system